MLLEKLMAARSWSSAASIAANQSDQTPSVGFSCATDWGGKDQWPQKMKGGTPPFKGTAIVPYKWRHLGSPARCNFVGKIGKIRGIFFPLRTQKNSNQLLKDYDLLRFLAEAELFFLLSDTDNLHYFSRFIIKTCYFKKNQRFRCSSQQSEEIKWTLPRRVPLIDYIFSFFLFYKIIIYKIIKLL